MPFCERGQVRIHYEEKGSGFPLMVIPGGGLNSLVAGLKTHPSNPLSRGLYRYHPNRLAGMDERVAGGRRNSQRASGYRLEYGRRALRGIYFRPGRQ